MKTKHFFWKKMKKTVESAPKGAFIYANEATGKVILLGSENIREEIIKVILDKRMKELDTEIEKKNPTKVKP